MLPSAGSRREIAKSDPIAKIASRVVTMCCRATLEVSCEPRSRPVVTRTEPFAGSSFETAVITGPTNWASLREPLATQSAPPPAARSSGVVPVPNVLVERLPRSMRVTVLSSALSVHTAPAPLVRPTAPAPIA